VDLVLNLPFPRTGFVGYDQTGKDFALWLSQGTDTVAVGGASMWHGKFMEPFAYVKTDDGLRYYRKDGDISQEDVRPVFRLICAILVKLSERKSEAHMLVVRDTFLNRKRKEKGKPAVSFDWRTVEIGPWVRKAEPQGGTHASPRLHDRRGHWRTIKPSGKRVWVKPCKVGDASKGMVFKDYRVAQ
jgi:hypothetical protein